MSKAVERLQTILNQQGSNLKVDGILGPNTKKAIDKLNIPLYLKIALKEIGTQEITGPKHNKQILKYHSVAGGFTKDEVPWCGSFIAWVMLQAGYNIVKYPARALSWLKFGIHTDEPVIGSIAVKTRRGGGHVCIIVGTTKNGRLLCIGGNQSNEVNISLYNKNAFIDFRLPLNTSKQKLNTFVLSAKTTIIKES
ncbi:MAG: TIGR02594 family protein [Epsilonproteobacteria bacterium]|nr:TIGR02594 family protein [Campylobacterota bacterium]